MNILKLR